MLKNHKKCCEVCKEGFSLADLYPIPLIRHNVLQAFQKVRPDIAQEGFVCYPDLRAIHANYYQKVLEKEKGTLSDLEQEVIDSIKGQELLSENVNEQFDEIQSFGERLSDKIAEFGGSWKFLILFGLLISGSRSIGNVNACFQAFSFR